MELSQLKGKLEAVQTAMIRKKELCDMENLINRAAYWIKFFIYSFFWLGLLFVFLLGAYATGLVPILQGELFLGFLNLVWLLPLTAFWFSSGVEGFMEALNKAKGQ